MPRDHRKRDMVKKARWKRRYRRRARRKGMCSSCGTRTPTKGRKTCDPCLESKARSKRKMKLGTAADGCIECLAVGFHRDGCAAATQKAA